MKDARAALRYAKAVLNLAKDSSIEERVNEDMVLMANTIHDSSELEILLKSPVIRSSEKIKVLNALFSDNVRIYCKTIFYNL